MRARAKSRGDGGAGVIAASCGVQTTTVPGSQESYDEPCEEVVRL